MVTTSFRMPESWLDRMKAKLGPFAVPSGLLRVLVGMWLDGKIEISNEDVEKYS